MISRKELVRRIKRTKKAAKRQRLQERLKALDAKVS